MSAAENRAFAQALIAERPVRPASSRWAAVAAFYAAVHYVNAYLREHLEIEPSNHTERSRFISSVSGLRSCRSHYVRLEAAAFDARYVAGSRIGPEEARELIDHHLETVRATVLPLLETEL